MEYTRVAERIVGLEELGSFVPDVPVLYPQMVDVGSEVRGFGAHDLIVGVHDEQVVGLAEGQRDRLGPVVSEVDPWPVVDLAGDPVEFFPDDGLRVVDASRVDDHVAVDQGEHRFQAPRDHTGLVLHDHVQAYRHALTLRTCTWRPLDTSVTKGAMTDKKASMAFFGPLS